MTFVDLTGAFGYGTKLTSTQMQNLRDNVIAVAGGDGTPALAIPPSAFVPREEDYDWYILETLLQKRTATTAALFFAPVNLPHGVTVTKLTLYGHRDDAGASMVLDLKRCNKTGTSDDMATAAADWTSGYSSIYDDSISNAVIDNDTYQYVLELTLTPNDAVTDVKFSGAVIDFSL